jgi:hypothetical protein
MLTTTFATQLLPCLVLHQQSRVRSQDGMEREETLFQMAPYRHSMFVGQDYVLLFFYYLPVNVVCPSSTTSPESQILSLILAALMKLQVLHLKLLV